MASSEEDATRGLAEADDVTGGGGGEDAVLADEELLDAMGGANLCDELDHLGVPVAAIAADDEEGI